MIKTFKVQLRTLGRCIYEHVEAPDQAHALEEGYNLAVGRRQHCSSWARWGLNDTEVANLKPMWAKEVMLRDHSAWCILWNQAMANMPVRKCYVANPENARAGQYSALARCLGLKLYNSRRRFMAHNWIYAAMTRGYEPKDEKIRSRLIKLAGPYGAVFAKIKLTQLGLAHRYHFGERPFKRP